MNTAKQLLKYHFILTTNAGQAQPAKWRSSQCLDWCQHVWGHQAPPKVAVVLVVVHACVQPVGKHAHFYIL